MYASLKPWVNIPYKIKPFLKRSGSGYPQYDEPIDRLCYPEAKNILVKDSKGAEVISSHQLYVDGDTDVDVNDLIIFEGSEHPIISINSFYRNGTVDIKVIHL
jgi:hypothetical protein